jgi:hypothetical protein
MLLLAVQIGCQWSLTGQNQSGNFEMAVTNARESFRDSEFKILFRINEDVEAFDLAQDVANEYGVSLVEYFPDTSREERYMRSYNDEMRLLLKSKYGIDVYDKIWSSIDKTQYFDSPK